MPTPCATEMAQASEGLLTPEQADELLARMANMAKIRAEAGQSLEQALSNIAGEIKAEAQTMSLIKQRNDLLTLRAKQTIKAFARRFPTLGEGLLTFLEGSSKVVEGSRQSVDLQAKSLHGKFLGRFIADLEQAGALKKFMDDQDEFSLFVYREMAELDKPDGKIGITGDKEAAAVAKALHDVTAEMVSMQNMAGAYITKLPGYVIRQTHDRDLIRRAGGMAAGQVTKQKSFEVWKDFVTPLLDWEKTASGMDREKFLRNVHESIYAGKHGAPTDEAEIVTQFFHPNYASKASRPRLLHFKGPDEAHAYNTRFGIKSLKDGVFSDLFFRSRSIALMQAFGPSPKATFESLINELGDEARASDDAIAQGDSLRMFALESSFNEISGFNDIPRNLGLAKAMSLVRAVANMAKMGGVVLSSFSDKAFMQSEFNHQGMRALDTLASQFLGLVPRTGEGKRTLRLMGVALDGIIGNTVSRYTRHATTQGVAHHAQQRFFSWNLMNWWNDVNKATVAELTAAHLGEHAKTPFEELPRELKVLMKQYSLDGDTWQIMPFVSQANDDGTIFIRPDMVNNIPRHILDTLMSREGLAVTPANTKRMLDKLETNLRAYIIDRSDIGVPTPGAAEKRFTTFNTQSGTFPGEVIRMLMMFKSFPITIASRILGREMYGHGAMTAKEFLMSDHKGKFNLLMLVAATTAAGYLSGVVRDAIKGRTPKKLINDDNEVNWAVVNEAALRGGGLGIFGDILLGEYDRSYKSFLAYAAGPVIGQADNIMTGYTKARQGEEFYREAEKLTLDNTPYINLFYIRPVLDYLVFWQIQEWANPGSLQRQEQSVIKAGYQDYFVRPSETVK